MKKTIFITSTFIFFLSIIFYSCLQDRNVPTVTPITRPQFVGFDPVGGNGLNVSLNASIKMTFDEQMDLNTFPNNFIVESSSGQIKGTFIYGETDTIVIFTPLKNYSEAEYYTAALNGSVMDKYGNSMISPTDADQPQSTWFFTTGKYAENGFPYIFVRDKVNKKIIYRVGNLNEYQDSLILPGVEDFQTEDLAVDPVMDYLYVVNLKTTNGYVTIINPQTMSVVNQVEVGFGPTGICFSDSKAFTANNFDRSFSVIDLNSHVLDKTVKFNEGFSPQSVVYSKSTQKLFFAALTSPSLEIVDVTNYQNSHQLENVADNEFMDMEVTNDGSKIYLVEAKSSEVAVLDASSEEVIHTIDFGLSNNVSAAMGDDAFYLAYYSGTGGEHNGGILKIDLNSNDVIAQLEWEYQVDQMKLTNAGELLYCVTPVDSTIQIVGADQLHRISQVKVKGSLNGLAITKKHYK